MADIYEFKGNEENDQEQESCCSLCDLAWEYTSYAMNAIENGRVEDLFGVLRSLVDESGKLALVEYLKSEVEHNIQLLDHLHGYCDNCDGECENKNED